MQSLPTSSTTARASTLAIARQILRSVGPGWQAPQDSLTAADALAFAASLDDGRLELLSVLDQAFASSATELLSELEALYSLPVDAGLTTSERQARLTAYVRASSAGTPDSIASALEALTGGPCSVGDSTPGGRSVFLFACVVPLGFVQLAVKNARVRDLVDRMKPAHTDYTVVNAVGFYCDGFNNTFLDCTALGS